ncbi:28S ribosomal protein S5, mitochondrial-like [Mizuhopecten yessoensis]|uniref:Small ribosomal subunit protein uS5m n=1 Tax=Mizuhopecten yessoensis TaxID=6573 RepID=A0A210QNQ7_MIZYE|nr:28S ribosomal protein S5, mitochondrial-like [Mizuhopecten yessoensis]OWF50369.1 28S ribosomal protein S5, mitochondrial [Mizuhopecten yessoensis]
MAAFGMLLGRSILRSTRALEVNSLLTGTVSRPLLETCCRPTTIIITRDASFFNRLSAEQVWDSVQGVSNQGKMKGRAKGKRKRFRVVKQFGEGGKFKMIYPAIGKKGLETNISSEKVEGAEIDDKTDTHTKKRPKREKLFPLQRGYTGRRVVGKRLVPPKPQGQFTFEGFEAVCVHQSIVANMTGTLGRKRSFTTLVVLGNGKGLAGYASATSTTQFRCIDKARHGASQQLQHIDLYDGHTVFHNIRATVGCTTVLVNKQDKGYGLKCHRIIKSICDLAGIKNLHVKVEGRRNEANIAKAFFKALIEQETHQELADRMKMHVVEFRREKHNYPLVVASPQGGAINDPPRDKEYYDFENFYFKGKTQFFPKRPAPFYQNTPSWYKKSHELYKRRNQKQAQMERRIQGFEFSGGARRKE